MKAIVQDRYGGPEVLRLVGDLPVPFDSGHSELAESGVLRPVIQHRHRLEEAADALRRHEDEPAYGKIVLTVTA